MEDVRWAVGVVLRGPNLKLDGADDEWSRAVRVLTERVNRVTDEIMAVLAEDPLPVPAPLVRRRHRHRRQVPDDGFASPRARRFLRMASLRAGLSSSRRLLYFCRPASTVLVGSVFGRYTSPTTEQAYGSKARSPVNANQPRRGFSIRIYLADGLPDGLRTVEKSNWTGRAVVCPRSRFPEAKSRPEFARTGVYVLRGPSDVGDLPTIYVGEGDPTRPRLESHFAKKDFWTQLTLFTSKDESLNKAHVQYLEARLLSLAAEAKRCVLDNGNMMQLPSMTEADMAEMDSILDEMLLIYPLLGLSAFDVPRREQASSPLLFLKGKGVVARGHERDEGFVVLAGSQAVKDEVPSISRFLIDMRVSLKERGLLAVDGDYLKLTQDYTFDSPSTAAGVRLGRNINGRVEWQDEQGRTLKALQAVAIGANTF